MLTIAIPAGLLIGLSLGALGGGGSVLTVPILVYLLHQPPHAATAGSLLIVGITATGRPAHARRREPASPGQGGGAGRPRCFLIPGRGRHRHPGPTGERRTDAVASRVDASRLTAAFAVLLVAVAAYSLTRSLPGLV